MIDGRRRALPQLFQPIGEWPCARRIAGRPRANAPPSRRSRRNAALAPPAETGPFGLRIALRRRGVRRAGGAGAGALLGLGRVSRITAYMRVRGAAAWY